MSDQNAPRPLAAERRAHILSALGAEGAVRISQLRDSLGAAMVTLRRDLADMEREGLLTRVHGGAVAVPTPGAPRAAPHGAGETLGSIAVLVPSLAYYWPGVLRAMEATGRDLGYEVILRGASYELQDERPVLERLLRDERVKGLIVAPNTDTEHGPAVIRWLADCGVPSVLVERDAVLEPEGVPVESVTTDHALGAVLAARHLARLGHRKVGLILSRSSPTSRKITAGWLRACEELGLTPADHFEQQLPDRASPDFSAVVNATLETALENGVTAILVHSDPEAMAFVDLALDRGISVPGDLSVVAYDDEVARLFTPALTAVSPPRAGVGEAAVQLLVQRIENPGRPSHRVQLDPQLIVRDSSAAPAPRRREPVPVGAADHGPGGMGA